MTYSDFIDQELEIEVKSYPRHLFDTEHGGVCSFDAELISGSNNLKEFHKYVGPELDCIQLGSRIIVYGHRVQHPKYGNQIQYSSAVETIPQTENAVIRYLMQSPGLGKQYASFLVDEYGVSVIDKIIGEKIDLAHCKVSFIRRHANDIKSDLTNREQTRRTWIDLTGLLAHLSLPRKIVNALIAEYGVRAAEKIRQNPYLLVNYNGCSFDKADSLYIHLGKDPAGDLRRLEFCKHFIKENQRDSGSIWTHLSALKNAVARKFQQSSFLKSLLESPVFVIHTNYCALSHEADIEHQLFASINDMVNSQCEWPVASSLTGITLHQKTEYAKGVTGRIAIITGGPGTGKTYTVANIIRQIVDSGRGNVIVVAPTGKAASRIREVLASHGVNVPCSTIHSALRLFPGEEESRFTREDPLQADYVIVDESTMMDMRLMSNLVQAMDHANGAGLMLVGDPNQLQPVGTGSPFLKILEKLPHGKLTEVHRNDAGILKMTNAIINSSVPEIRSAVKMPEVVLTDASSDEKKLQFITHYLEDIWHHMGQEEFDDGVQFISFLNSSNEISREQTNTLIRSVRNPMAGTDSLCPLDKVICLKNTKMKASTSFVNQYADMTRREKAGIDMDADGAVKIYNGDIGRVIENVDEHDVLVRFLQPNREVIVPKSGMIGGQKVIDLGWCISTHKSQGSEWNYVFVTLDSSYAASLIRSRNLLVTAASRAKKMLVINGTEKELIQCVRRNEVDRVCKFHQLIQRDCANIELF